MKHARFVWWLCFHSSLCCHKWISQCLQNQTLCKYVLERWCSKDLVVCKCQNSINWYISRHSIKHLTLFSTETFSGQIENAWICLKIWKAILQNKSSLRKMEEVKAHYCSKTWEKWFCITWFNVKDIWSIQIIIIQLCKCLKVGEAVDRADAIAFIKSEYTLTIKSFYTLIIRSINRCPKWLIETNLTTSFDQISPWLRSMCHSFRSTIILGYFFLTCGYSFTV